MVGANETVGAGYKAPRRFNIAQRWRWLYDILHKRVTASGDIAANLLVKPSGTSVVVTTLRALDAVGVVEEAIADTAEGYAKIAGHAWITAGETIAFGNNLKAALAGKIGVFIDSGIVNTQIGDLTGFAGDDFGNQPANDTVDVASDAAGDITQTVTVWGQENGGTVIVSEDYVLVGAATVVGTTDFDTVLAVVVDAACAGTITVTENSGGLTITTLTAGVLQKGWNDVTDGYARFGVPDLVSSGASVKIVGVIGLSDAGAALSEDIQLTGVAQVALANSYQKITAVLTGDVESGQTVSGTITDTEDDENCKVGKALEAIATADLVCETLLAL